jgi:very-short-patch-repair endonuclease
VYALGHLRPDPVSRAAAAVLACGPGAVLSHDSAASLWGFGDKHWKGPIHVTVPRDCRRRGIKIHRTTLARANVTMHHGIRVTRAARTLLDVAPEWDRRRLTRGVNDALLSNYLYESQLSDILDRCLRHKGAKALAAVDPNRSRSDFEDDFTPFARRFGLPKPQINARVNGREVDALFPEHRLIVELDGWGTHRTRYAFEDDRERDAEMLKNGLATVRITKERLIGEPEREAARLLAILKTRTEVLRTSETRLPR